VGPSAIRDQRGPGVAEVPAGERKAYGDRAAVTILILSARSGPVSLTPSGPGPYKPG